MWRVTVKYFDLAMPVPFGPACMTFDEANVILIQYAALPERLAANIEQVTAVSIPSA